MPKLVNLGSLCIDHVYRVAGIAGLGETVASESYAVFPGGKGLNQSVAAAKAGAAVVHVGAVGADGAWLRDALAAAGVDAAGVRAVAVASGHAVIQVNAAGENAIVVSGGANRALAPEDVRAALDRLAPGDWLLLQNEVNDLETILDQASRVDCQVAFNVAPADGREAGYDLSSVALLIVNEVEAAALAGVREPRAAAAALRQRWPNAELVLTLGAEGLIHGGSDGLADLPAFPVQAVDETAAGDTFIGFLMASLLAGAAMPEALRLGSAAGALAVTKAGAASSIPTLDTALALAATGDARKTHT